MASSSVRSTALTGLLSGVFFGSVFALGLSDLTNQDAARGIKGALYQEAASVIGKLGVPGGPSCRSAWRRSTISSRDREPSSVWWRATNPRAHNCTTNA